MFLCICWELFIYYVNLCSYLFADFSIKSFSQNRVSILNPIRSGGGALKDPPPPPPRCFALTHLILELHYYALGTFPKK